MKAARTSGRGDGLLLGFGMLVIAAAAWLQHGQAFTVHCADNSGAYNLRVIGKVGKTRQTHAQNENAHIMAGDMVVVVGKSGAAKNKVMRAVMIRMRKQMASPERNGFHFRFDTNAAVIVDGDGNPVGSKIVGPIDPRVALRWPKLAMLVR